MPALVSSMPMPSYDVCVSKGWAKCTRKNVGAQHGPMLCINAYIPTHWIFLYILVHCTYLPARCLGVYKHINCIGLSTLSYCIVVYRIGAYIPALYFSVCQSICLVNWCVTPHCMYVKVQALAIPAHFILTILVIVDPLRVPGHQDSRRPLQHVLFRQVLHYRSRRPAGRRLGLHRY